jgi:hypothetical protein
MGAELCARTACGMPTNASGNAISSKKRMHRTSRLGAWLVERIAGMVAPRT